MDGEREEGKEEREAGRRGTRLNPFLKKSKAPLLDGQIIKGHPMLRGRYEKKKDNSSL